MKSLKCEGIRLLSYKCPPDDAPKAIGFILKQAEVLADDCSSD